MQAHPSLLILDLAKVLGAAALTTLLCRRLKLPAVLGYLLAGLIVGPHVPVPLVADLDNVQTLAELGVILVLFSVGLEFDLKRLAREGLPAVLLGAVQVGLATWLGFMTGRALGWGVQESALMGGALAVSSTMIIAKLFEEHGARGPLRDLVFSVGLVQDLYALLLLAGLGAAGAGSVGLALGRVGLFLAGLLVLGGLLLPPVLRWAADHGRDETLLVVTVGSCFASVVLATRMGCSPAMGAVAAGMLAAASRRVRPIERLVQPLRDMFGAIFFVAVGMLLDPRQLASQAGPILALTAAILLASTLGGTLGAAVAGLPLPTGFRAGLTLAQPGELSFVLVGAGAAAGLLGPRALPVAVGVAFLAAILGPWTFRRGEALAATLDRLLPAKLHRCLAPFQGWATFPALRKTRERALAGPVTYLILDALLLNLLVLGAAHGHRHPLLAHHPGATAALLGAALAALIYLAWALCRRVGQIADLVLEGWGRPMLGLALLLVVGAPAFALLQPLLPRGPALALCAGVLVCLGILLRLPAHRPHGAEWLVQRVQRPWRAAPDPPLALAAVRLGPACPFVGRPLGDLALALEDLPGAALVAVERGGLWLGAPPELRLQAGDRVALWGTRAVQEAVEALLGGRRHSDPP